MSAYIGPKRNLCDASPFERIIILFVFSFSNEKERRGTSTCPRVHVVGRKFEKLSAV
jgi:hypothetical protein